MWNSVTPRFSQFQSNLTLTPTQFLDGHTKARNVSEALNQHYYGQSHDLKAYYAGSWRKGTQIRPPRDIDLMFVLPFDVYRRFESRLGNKQSALLQEVKDVLHSTFPTTDLKGDGQVVKVDFNSYSVEVVPAFLLTDGKYWICDSNDGGHYRVADPVSEYNVLNGFDQIINGNLRTLIRYAKCWQYACDVPIKSFWIELLAIEFLKSWPYRTNSTFWHDWMTRDFFRFLQAKGNSYLSVPGTSENINLGDQWVTRAETAYGRAVKAENFEYMDLTELAGEEWQKIFGDDIPRSPIWNRFS